MNTQEENFKTQPGNQRMKGKVRQYQIFLILLLIVVAALVIWLFLSKSKLNNLLNEKEQQRIELTNELDSLLGEHEKVKLEYGQLADSLTVKDSVIQANAIEIRKLLDTQWEYYKIKKKLARLQEVSQGYVRQMDSLYRVNEALSEENELIRKDLQQVKREKDLVMKDKEMLQEKVGIASVLQAYNITVEGIRSRGGGSRDKVTDKATRLDKIKVCFTISKNEILTPGIKEVYVRIARPDKEILTKDRTQDYTFIYQGEPIQYSMKEEIDYRNEAMDLCLYWFKKYEGQPIDIGTYHVDIFADDNVIGHTTFTLR
ncbi:MAG: hypothetical protein KKA81_09510 [Bacteroidetes bacterium]|nr:hypothetical protein [Bacteroidota bacterium]